MNCTPSKREVMITAVGTFSGVALAAGHVLSCNIEFSNEKGRVLWRGYSLCLLAGVVLCGLPILILWKLKPPKADPSPSQRSRLRYWIHLGSFLFLFNLAAVGTFAYIIARVFLFYLTVQSFSNLPAGVYDDIDWSQYIPYFH